MPDWIIKYWVQWLFGLICAALLAGYRHLAKRVKEQEEEELFRKFTETHYQRGYTLQQIKRLLEKSGLVFMDALDADTLDEVTDTSERIFCVAREQGKVCDRSPDGI